MSTPPDLKGSSLFVLITAETSATVANVANEPSLFGKKVIFLHPHSVLNEVIHLLTAAEFEVYTATDEAKLARYLRGDPNCLVFVNIDEGPDEGAWRAWIRSAREALPPGHAGFGALTLQPNEETRSAYLMDVGVECGFVTVTQGASKTADILIKTLEANEARGRRRYVRAACQADEADFNYLGDVGAVRGTLRDLSSVGMSALFTEGGTPKPGTLIKDLQLNLRGARLRMNGVVLGGHDDHDEGSIRVVMFDPKSMDDEKRTKLRSFVRKVLQARLDALLIGA